MDRGPLQSLLMTEDLLQIFYGTNTFSEPSMNRRPLPGLLWIQTHLQDHKFSQGLKTFSKSFIDEITSQRLARTEDFSKASLGKRPVQWLLWAEVLKCSLV